MTAPAVRTQVDGLNAEYAWVTGLDCSDRPDMARQEFKDESDVNKVLLRYGVDGNVKPAQYSEVDYDLDLQKSIEAIREAQRSIAKLPPELRPKYNSWERLFDGVYNGELETDLAAYHEAQRAEKEALDTAAAAAASSREPLTDPRD